MKTVIKNSAQDPCLHISLTPRFSEADQPQCRLRSCFNSFPGHPTKSEYIRPNPSNFSPMLKLQVGQERVRRALILGRRNLDSKSTESDSVKPSPTWSNQIQPPHPLPAKKSVKKRPALRSALLTIVYPPKHFSRSWVPLTAVVGEGV
jgi:hypothetical protein